MGIRTLKMGPVNAYLVKGSHGWLLVDSGMPRQKQRFLDELSRVGVDPGQIVLAMATHAHVDHAGNLAMVQRRSGCRVLVHRSEASLLEQGRMEAPPPRTRVSRAMTGAAKKLPGLAGRWSRYEPVKPDITLDRSLDLEEYGFAARILPTPGHSPGSMTVLTRLGQALTGDLVYNILPWYRRTRVPSLFDGLDQVLDSWRTLLDQGARTIYPGHGPSFDAGLLKRELARGGRFHRTSR